jgi:hypothetical protein
MTPVNGDIDQTLRSALHAEVDSIEPGDGLERIRRRTHAPWLVRQASLMLTECVDLARLIVIRLEPAFTGLRTAIRERGGPWEAFVGVLGPTVASIVTLVKPSRRRSPNHRGPRSGSNLGWLRPALAVAGAVVIVVAGVYGLAQVRDNLALELFRGGTPASTGPGTSSDGGSEPSLQGQTPSAVIVPPGSPAASATPSPTPTCSRAQQAQATPTPTVTGSSTPTATPTPTDSDDTTSPSPTPTSTASTSALQLGSTGIHTVADVVRTGCQSASPSPSPSQSP